MSERRTFSVSSGGGERHCVSWAHETPRHLVLVSHGYAEHVGRYEHLAAALVEAGAGVYAIDHVGHGRSSGDRAVVPDIEAVVDDLHRLDRRARAEHPGLPVVLLGHSLGGLIATRYAQLYGESLTALVLSAPQLGGGDLLTMLLDLPEMPSFPVDASVLSRDPEVGADYLGDPLVWHGDLQRPTAEAMVAALRAVDGGPRLDTLPVLWLHGTDDQLSPLEGARPLVESVASGSLRHHVYPGALHEIFHETNKHEVITDLVDFLGVVTAPTRST